jgi:hypothetical protein
MRLGCRIDQQIMFMIINILPSRYYALAAAIAVTVLASLASLFDAD